MPCVNVKCTLKEKYPNNLFKHNIILSNTIINPNYNTNDSDIITNDVLNVRAYVSNANTPYQGITIEGVDINPGTRYSFFVLYSNFNIINHDYYIYRFITYNNKIYEIKGNPIDIDEEHYVVRFSATLKGDDSYARSSLASQII